MSDRETIGFDPDAPFWMDIGEFRLLLERTKAHRTKERFAQNVSSSLKKRFLFYRGDFLEGFDPSKDCPEFDDWQHLQRRVSAEFSLYTGETNGHLYCQL